MQKRILLLLVPALFFLHREAKAQAGLPAFLPADSIAGEWGFIHNPSMRFRAVAQHHGFYLDFFGPYPRVLGALYRFPCDSAGNLSTRGNRVDDRSPILIHWLRPDTLLVDVCPASGEGCAQKYRRCR